MGPPVASHGRFRPNSGEKIWPCSKRGAGPTDRDFREQQNSADRPELYSVHQSFFFITPLKLRDWSQTTPLRSTHYIEPTCHREVVSLIVLNLSLGRHLESRTRPSPSIQPGFHFMSATYLAWPDLT